MVLLFGVSKVFCESDNLQIDLLSVTHLSWKGGFFNVAPRKHCALIYRVSGNGVFTVDGKEMTSTRGDVFFMPQGQKYTANYTDGEIIAFHFIATGEIGEAENYTFPNSDDFYKLFMKAEIVYNSNGAGSKNRTVSLLYEILAMLCETKSIGAFPPAVLDAISFIRANFKNSSLSVPYVCRKCGIGETSMRTNFRQYLGKTPVQYITELRLQYAKGLILSGVSVENAAIQSGFCDPKYFSRLVKKHFGCTPRELNQYDR